MWAIIIIFILDVGTDRQQKYWINYDKYEMQKRSLSCTQHLTIYTVVAHTRQYEILNSKWFHFKAQWLKQDNNNMNQRVILIWNIWSIFVVE